VRYGKNPVWYYVCYLRWYVNISMYLLFDDFKDLRIFKRIVKKRRSPVRRGERLIVMY